MNKYSNEFKEEAVKRVLVGVPTSQVAMSMSRKGNCWDNAPMESFWGTLKQEWLNEKHFHTRAEAKAAVFEYIWIFYNRQRIHSSNNYQTPEEYYMERLQVEKIAA